MRLAAKVALVSGATGGIGAAISKRFAREGAKVVVTDLDAALGRRLVEEISTTGGEAYFRVLDVTWEEHWKAAFRRDHDAFRAT